MKKRKNIILTCGIILSLIITPIYSQTAKTTTKETSKSTATKTHLKPTIGILLSGAGVYDGSEVQEAILTLLYLDQLGTNIVYLAPNKTQLHVINHNSKAVSKESTRNILTESSRLTRGNVIDVKNINANDLDALILPGGFGAAKNLSTFALKGADCSVDPDVETLIKTLHSQKKPLGFICIAPVIAAKVIKGATVTIGQDAETAEAIENMGGTHIVANVEDIVIDKENNIISTPAYMLGLSIGDISEGISKLVNKVHKLSLAQLTE